MNCALLQREREEDTNKLPDQRVASSSSSSSSSSFSSSSMDAIAQIKIQLKKEQQKLEKEQQKLKQLHAGKKQLEMLETHRLQRDQLVAQNKTKNCADS